MVSTDLKLQPPTSGPQFNWFFLVELIVCGILSLFFFFYFNRLFATLVSYGVRAYTWHYYRAYVDIQALQISLLGGRIFFKGIRYHGVNETILVHGGYVTWNYWKRAVKRVDLARASGSKCRPGSSQRNSDAVSGSDHDSEHAANRGETGGVAEADRLPCRIVITVYGLEWFIYNRTPAYDDILSGFASAGDQDSVTHGSRSPSPGAKSTGYASSRRGSGKGLSARPTRTSSDPSIRESSSARNSHAESTVSSDQHVDAVDSDTEDSISKLLQLLPVKVECTKGAIVAGNENTRSVLTVTFEKATGLIDASDAGPLDLYRQIFTFEFTHPIIQLRPNPDFKYLQLEAAAAHTLSSMPVDEKRKGHKRATLFNYQRKKREIWHSIRDLIPYFQKSVESFHVDSHHERGPNTISASRTGLSPETRWLGLTRYLDENTDEHEGWNSVEYARFSTLVDCPALTLTYYWDIPGRVPSEQAELSSSIRKVSQDINGSNPPEWGLDLKIDGGTINYGPWADRERVGLQNVFFPNPYRSAQPAEPLTPGAWRRSTVFRVRVEINQDTTLRIPTREESKDWQWKGRADAIRGASKLKKQKQKRQWRNKEGEKGTVGPEIRPFGWLSLRVSRDSTITYNMDMVPSKTGYHNYLTLDLRESRMSSSVNHGLLWQCPRQIISCDLSNSLTWNSLHQWEFKVESRDMELFLLRDHIFLITDLVSDWTSGSAPDYYTFVPFIYNIKLLFTNFQLFMNVNDSNIINNPSDLDDNTFVVVKGKQLTSHVGIPATKYKPEENTVTFELKLEDGGLDLLTPLWHTLHTFLRDKSVATLNDLIINGSYTYNSATSSALTDTLVMDISGGSPRLYLYGFLIRYFMRVRENYFGEEIHFRTLEEFQEAANAQEPSGAHGLNPNRKSNDLDVILRVNVDSPCVLLPTNIYDHSKSLRLTAASIELDMRFTNYYMDLQAALSPVEVSLESLDSNGAVSVSNTQLFIDGVSIYGHRLFGLPPTEPTYVCNWDFEVGKVVGECSPDFLRSLLAALRDIDFTFDDHENALPPLHPVALHDVTFLRARVASVHMSVLVDRTALILGCDAITVQFNDWARWRFSKRLSLTVPNITVAAVDRKSPARWQGKGYSSVTTYALFETNVKLTMLHRKSNFHEDRRLQQEHIRLHDQRTHRTPWLLLDPEQADGIPSSGKGTRVDPPAMVVPSMPEPVVDATAWSDMSSSSSASRFQSSLKHKSSFLSLGASSSHSKSSIPKGSMSRSKSQISEVRSNDDRVSGDKARHFRQRGETKFYPHDSLSEEPQPSILALSSPWAMPHFHYYKVVPDSTQLPPLPPVTRATETSVNDRDFIGISEDDKTTHVDIFCELSPGLRGFCTPEFLLALSSLVQGLEPVEPVDIIDSLQTGVVSDIVKHEKAIKSPKATTSFSVRIPSTVLRLLNLSDSENDSQFQFQDEYKVSLTHLKATLQTEVERKEDDLVNGIQQNVVIHAAADMLSVSALGKRADAFQEQAELSCSLREIVLWLATVPSTQSHLQMRSFETVTSTKSVEPLAFLVQRTTTLLDSITSSFQQASSSVDRLRYLVWSLTESAAGIPDPLFLTRPSSVLRVARSHLRLHDSWKILSRLRNIYKNLSPDRQQALKTNCIDLRDPCPPNAKSMVMESFDEWRPWDLARVEKSYAMKKIWGNLGSKPNDDAPVNSTTFSCAVKTFNFVVDPGPKESDFIVEGLFIALAVSSPKHQKEATSEGNKEIISLRSYCASAALRLRWEILDLVEGVTRTISSITLESTSPAAATEIKEKAPLELHVVLGADVGSVTLDGINLGLALMGYGLKGSLVHRPQHAEVQEQMSVLLSAEDCSAKFSSRSKVLMLWEILRPNVYSSYVLDRSLDNVVYDWKVACSCQKFLYDMKEDPLGLIHTADRVVEDEVRYVRDLLQRLELQTMSRPSTPPAEKPEKKSDVHQFHVALFLDDYQINFCLLPSLNYVIHGEVARMSVMSSKDSGVEVDFDIKSNYHVFQSMEEGKPQTVSEVHVPPINGRILGRLSPDLIWLKADVTVELIRLQASALRSLLNVVNRPEISHFVSDFKESVEELHLHFEDVLVREDPTPRSSDSSKSREILYNIQLTMAGMGIHARAPGLRSKEYSADMDFSFGAMQMRLDNASEQRYPSGYPEFHINVSQIALELRRQEKSQIRPYGSLVLDAGIVGTSRLNERNEIVRAYHLTSKSLDVELFAETASLVIDIAAHLQERIKTLDLSEDMKRFRKLGRLARPRNKGLMTQVPEFKITDESEPQSQALFNAMYSVELANIQASWIMDGPCAKSGYQPEDLVFSIRYVTLSTTRENAAKLRIQDMQLQMTPKHEDKRKRSLNSALMPEIVFNVAYLSTKEDLRLAFQAAGKSLDIRATTEFILPASLLQNSIASASEKLREANAIWATSPSQSNSGNGKGLFGNKRLSSLLVDVDFAGAIVSLLGRQMDDQQTLLAATVRGSRPAEGKYGQYVQGDSATTASLRAPGVALKVQYGDSGTEDPTLNAELRVSPSSNTLYPTVVPLIKQISASVKEVVGEQDEPRPSSSSKLQPQKMVQDNSLDATNPETILGRCKLNIGLRICKQEFSLSCQPIARVAATARFDDIYVTVNTVQSAEQRRFFAILIAFNDLQASVKHVYSNESTASFEVKSIVVSLMNSKHVSTSSGISAILKVSPMKIMVNAKQVQDFLLFREIWVPSGDEATFTATSPSPSAESQALIVQRYQQVASAGAFPWNTAIAIDELDIQLDLGQTLGKAEFTIKDLWVSSKKTSDWEQNLCAGFDTMAIESRGRMSGSVELRKLKVRTFIKWPDETPTSGRTPLIQASVAFDELQANASFEYQPFLVADIAAFAFLMYNVRSSTQPSQDRLVSILEGDKVQVFCTTLTASQSLALFQTWQRLVQDKYAAYEASLKEIERYLRRKSSVISSSTNAPPIVTSKKDESSAKAPISLHTDVVVTIQAINVGAFPSTFFDNQILKMEALDAQARFAVSLEDDKIHSALGLTLGELRVALSSISRPSAVELAELSVDEVAARATGSRGGTILKVPRVVASMETWQTMASNEIEYIFKSAFEGKVDVGWNYSRISFIRGMWTSHSRALASRLGKPLPPSAVRITGGPKAEHEGDEQHADAGEGEQQKITAVVNVPQSKYVYRPLEPPLIETPQLRDMGEATPPLEWIGLHRDKLPNITHQIIIVTLLEVAKEVEDAYSKILG